MMLIRISRIGDTRQSPLKLCLKVKILEIKQNRPWRHYKRERGKQIHVSTFKTFSKSFICIMVYPMLKCWPILRFCLPYKNQGPFFYEYIDF